MCKQDAIKCVLRIDNNRNNNKNNNDYYHYYFLNNDNKTINLLNYLVPKETNAQFAVRYAMKYQKPFTGNYYRLSIYKLLQIRKDMV